MAKVKEAKKAVESAKEYIDLDRNEAIDKLVAKIKGSKYAKIDQAIVGLMHDQIAILKLMKK